MPSILDPGKKIPEKIVKKLKKMKKPLSDIFFQPKWDEIGQERERKNFASEFRSNSTRARKFRKECQKN